jgi:N-acetylmuramoyl-L-alanine amidase
MLVLLAFAVAFAVPLGFLPIISPVPEAEEAAAAPRGGAMRRIFSLDPTTPTPAAPTPEPTPAVPHVGIIAGHSGHDSGALCPDGLREVDINMEIARRTVEQLQLRGWRVDLLDEFDDRLEGYQADALLSIHADSCVYPGKTGFKVARAESASAGLENELVRCVRQAYELATGLPFDANTITYDMTRYHVFYEIADQTPAVIIETGFMLDDRELLTERPDVVATGIANGLICFVEGVPPESP